MAPGPVSFDVINCRSVSCHPTIANTVRSRLLDLLVITDIHVRPTNTGSLLSSITPPGYKLCHRPHAHSLGEGVNFLVNHNIQFKIVDNPVYKSFENITITTGSKLREKLNKSCPVNILGSLLYLVGAVRNLGVWKPVQVLLCSNQILSVLEVIQHVMLLLWLQMLWSGLL